MSGLLVIALEALLFALLAADLATDLTLMTPAIRLGHLVLSAAVLLPFAWRSVRARIPRPARAAAIALGAATLVAGGLAAVSEAGSARMQDRWDSGATERLQARAALLEEDFRWLLDEMARPLAGPPGDTSRPQSAFERLEKRHTASPLPGDRFGLALYGTDGAAIAWAGNSSAAPADLLAAAGVDPVYMVAGHEEAPRLFVARRDAATAVALVSEFLLRPPQVDPSGETHPGMPLEFLPHWSAIAPATVLPRFAPPDADAAPEVFTAQGNRHWWRSRSQGVLTLSMPLRSPSGPEMLTANLGDRHVRQEVQARRTVVRRIGVLLLAGGLVLAAALLLRRLPNRAARVAAGLGAVAGLRVLLLLLGSDDALPPLSAYDITVYASSSLFGLLRSPADLLLTAAAALGIAWILRGAILSVPRPADRREARLLRAVAALACLLAAGASLAGLHAFLDRVVLESRTDLMRVDMAPPLLARLALQGGLFLLVAAAGTLVAALAGLALGWGAPAIADRRARRPGIPPVLRAVLATLALTAVYVPLLQHAHGSMQRAFFEFDLRPRVLYQSEGRLSILRDSLRAVEEPRFASATGAGATAAGRASLAYRLWVRTPLAAMGLASSLAVFDADGRLVSRFAVNLGEMFEPRFSEARDGAGTDPVPIPPREGVTIKKAVVFGSRWVGDEGPDRRLVVMTVVDDYDNVPQLSAESSYLPLQRARALSRTNPELLRFEPLVAVFGPSLERLYESGGEIPAPSPSTMAALGRLPYVWTSAAVGEGPARILYFRGPREVFAVAYVRRDLMGLVAAWLRISLLNGAVLLAALLAARGARALAGRPWAPIAPGGTIYARLTTVFLITALAPLLSLAWFVTRFSARESERNLVASGLASLQTVRRVAEDYMNLTNPGYGPDLDNEVVFWLSRVVRQDINLYKGPDLVSTSTPELYGSFLLNTRLEGSVYRALYLDREPFRLTRVPLAGLDYRALSAPMRLDVAGTIGVVSIPLAAQSRAVARRTDQIDDAILISSCLTIALLALVGWLVARRVSTPIALLAGASRRMAGGDLEVRVASPAGGEIGILVDSFNRMAESLEKQRDDLSRRSEYIETILATATTGVLSLDARGVLITINPAAQQLLAHGGGAAPGPGDDLAARLEDDPALGALGEALTRSLAGRLEGEVSIALGRGEEDRRLRAVFLPFTHGEDALPGRIVILEDVTDIVRSGRLAAWAEMARRVAHEVKNPLTPIQLSVEHVRRLWKAGDARFGTVLQECLDNIQGQVKALRQIATEFSAYARLPRLRPEPASVDDLLAEALRPYAAAPPPGVELRRAVEPDLPDLRIDRAIILRVLVNLVENALQAMPAGGRLEVEARRAPVPASRPGRRPDGGAVRITVRDTGEGIEADVLARIFEPYFSTKSGGTGLGLAIARNAIEAHGGTIEIESQPGAGTTVTIDLPVAAPSATAAAPVP